MKEQRNWPLRYDIRIRRKRFAFFIIALMMIAVGVYSMMSGSVPLTVSEVLWTLLGRGSAESNLVVFSIRLPRVMTALLVGASLAVCGVTMQCVLHNPLASASTLGVSQGAAFGAAVGILVFGGGVLNQDSSAVSVEINNPYIVSMCAFFFGSLCSVVVVLLSQLKKSLGPGALVLAGVALSSLFSGGSTLLQYFADETQLSAVVFWTFGNLGGTGWREILLMAVVFFASFLFFMLNRWNYNAMSSGTDVARSLGVNTRSVMIASMAICSLTAAISVALVGIISFIGLIAPHMMRKFVGDDYRFLIPCSAAAGAFVLLAADTFGRLIIAPVVLPIGAITSFLGAPVFLILLMKEGERHD